MGEQDLHMLKTCLGLPYPMMMNSERVMGFMKMLGYNEELHQIALANSVYWYGNVLSSEVGHTF